MWLRECVVGRWQSGLDSLARLERFQSLLPRRRNATKNQKYLPENYTVQAPKINSIIAEVIY